MVNMLQVLSWLVDLGQSPKVLLMSLISSSQNELGFRNIVSLIM